MEGEKGADRKLKQVSLNRLYDTILEKHSEPKFCWRLF